MKSISDILNSMVQPTEQNSLPVGSQSASSQGTNSSVGSFSDVLSRLNAQNAATANSTPEPSNNNTTTNSSPQNTGAASFPDTQITVTEVQVSETVQTNNLTQPTLTNIENAATAMAMALAKLVNLASQVQNLNQTQAQNLLVSASGGVLSASQAQQLVSQITALKNQSNGQNALTLTPEQQGALLLQMMQSMLQNQQISVTPTAPQNNQNSLSSSSQGSSLLQFNFAGNSNVQNGNSPIENLSIDIQTFNLQASAANSSSAQGSSQASNLTDATTQRLTHILQQLNVTPSATPVNVQVQSSVVTTNSPELARNFQNLVQILTQAGAGQAVLSTFLTQHKNDTANNNLQQSLNQTTQLQTGATTQPVVVTAIDSTGSANSALISNDNQSGTFAGQAQLLNDSLGGQNIQLSIPNSQTQSTGNSSQSAPITTNVSIPQNSALTNAGQNTILQLANDQPQPAALVANVQTQPVTNVAQNIPVQTTDNQIQTAPVANVQTQSVTNVAQNVAVQPTNNLPQPTAPVANVQTQPVTNVVQNTSVQATDNQPQPTAPVANVQTQPAPITTNVSIPQNSALTNAGQNTILQPANDQPQPAAPVTNVAQNTPPVQTTDNQLQTTPVASVQTRPVTNVAQNTPVQTTDNQLQATPVASVQTQPVTNVAQNTPVQATDNQPQPTAPVANVQTQPSVAEFETEPNNQNQPVVNTDSQTVLSQPQDVFANGQLEALNGIVARFNGGVVSGQGVNASSINTRNNINKFPTETQALNQTVPVTTAAPVLTAVAVTPVTETAANIILNNQNTQQSNNLTANNVQNQLVQPTSPTTQQVTNTINISAQDSFVQTAVNATVNNTVNATTAAAITNTNNTPAPNNQSTPVNSGVSAVQQVVTTTQATVPVVLSASNTASAAAVSAASSSPVVTLPVTTPASMTAQDVQATTVAGEVAKTAIPSQAPSNTANSNNNAAQVSVVSPVTAVQPATAQAVSQLTNTSESSTDQNTAGNSAKDTLSNTSNLQNLAAAVNSGMTTTTDRAGNSFQTTVNTVANSNPNGSVDSGQILNQIAQQVVSQTADAKMVSRLNFQLVPASLGRVNVQVALIDQSISARITVTNPDVREVLQQHMVDLKAALSQAGLQIDQLQVQVQGGGSSLLAQYYQYQQEGNSYRESAWTPSTNQEQAPNADNAGVLAGVGSNSVLNLLV